MKKRFFEIGFVFTALVFVGCATTHAWQGLVYNGESEQTLSGTRWELLEIFPSGGTWTHYIEFTSTGKSIWYYGDEGKENITESNNSTWELRGNSFKMTANDGYSLYEGNLTEINGIKTIIGTLKTSKDNIYEFTMTQQ
ncbi:hypothetical protein FACS1894110_15670 [Spirochaetia bacterium]|nr:hypothetical protein FACS1894110_15670 [Spirochaetia bacterium]